MSDFPCHEDEVLSAEGTCYNFEEVPVGVQIVADFCSVQGMGFCVGTVEATRVVPEARTELAHTGIEGSLAAVGVLMVLSGRFLARLASRLT